MNWSCHQIDTLNQFGCVLIDRGGREIPIQPDVVGQVVTVLPDQTVDVGVPEIDGKLAVDIVTISAEGT